jgi:hypothetical protein
MVRTEIEYMSRSHLVSNRNPIDSSWPQKLTYFPQYNCKSYHILLPTS